MDKSKMAKEGASHSWEFFKNDTGRAKQSRGIRLACDTCPGEMCYCHMMGDGEEGHLHGETGDPLSDHNPCGGGKIY